MKIYIAGAITNNPNYEEQFAKAEEKLIAAGHAVINPVKNIGFEYKDYIDMGLCELMHCDAIYLLPGWENSYGARLERAYAETIEMKIILEAEENTMKNNEIKPSESEIKEQKPMFAPMFEDTVYEPTVEISVSEYVRLKDMETRFSILRDQMLHSDYCAIHHQIILGIEKEYKQKTKELKTDLFPDALKK